LHDDFDMSGQSTLLRALGANVLLAKALDTCTVDHALIPATTVCTSIGHTDDLGRGVSYFYAEAEAIAEVLTEARRRRALFLFDELFRGTNAGERMAAAEMVMRAVLAGGPDTGLQFAALATHDLQLGELLADCIRPLHLAVDSDGQTLRFHYTLAEGPARSRTALTLLRRLGVPDELIDAAARRAQELEA
jgi:DNA mismatch repair ATPase MutS